MLVAAQERRLAPLAMARALRRLPALLSELSLTELDERATGDGGGLVPRRPRQPEREDAYWATRDYAAGVEKVTAPVQLIGGWRDIFLPWMLEDFSALQAARRNVQLIIGPWTHTAPGLMAAGLRDGIGWLRAGLLDDHRLVRAARGHGVRHRRAHRRRLARAPELAATRHGRTAAVARRARPAARARAARALDAGPLPLRPRRPHPVAGRSASARRASRSWTTARSRRGRTC